MYDKYFPNPFILGSLGIASAKGKYIGSYVNDLYNSSAVALGLVLIIFTSCVIYLDCLSHVRRRQGGWKGLVLPIVGYFFSWGVIIISSGRSADHKGNLDACFALGYHYEQGRGLDQDYSKAAELYAKVAEGGNAKAQYKLSFLYMNGQGVIQNDEIALKWCRKAADQGYVKAQHAIGYYHAQGLGVVQDYEEAVKWFQRAAEQGYADSQNNLGWCYEKGLGVKRDPVEAVNWYRRSASQGFPEAQYSLGVCYSEGVGVSKNIDEAVKYFSLAAQKGHKKSIAKLASLGENPPPRGAEGSGGSEPSNP